MKKISKTNLVLKFGGTSVSSVENWQNICEIIKKKITTGYRLVVVCSAPAGVSDLLERLLDTAIFDIDRDKIFSNIVEIFTELADQLAVTDTTILKSDFDELKRLVLGTSLLGEISPRVAAQIMSTGELLLSRLGYAFLKNCGLNIHWQDVREWLTVSPSADTSIENHYLAARCDIQENPHLLASINAEVVITQGFIAQNDVGETVLLGRGGSDTSGAYIARLIAAQHYEIWTDVPGIYTANPRQIAEARFIHQLDFQEAQEIAAMGGKVLHPNCIAPLEEKNIPIHIQYTPDLNRVGTVISHHGNNDSVPIKSVLTRFGVMLISIETLRMWQQVGFLADIFTCFKKHGISVDLVSTSESTVTVSLDPSVKQVNQKRLQLLMVDLNQFATAKLMGPCASVSLVGKHIRTVLSKLGGSFEVFEQHRIYLMSQAANDLNLTFVVDEQQADRLAKKLHTLLIEQTPTSHIFKKSWHFEFGVSVAQTPQTAWWQQKANSLLTIAKAHGAVYVYDQQTASHAAKQLKSIQSIDQVFYSVKANSHLEILKLFEKENLGFECVSLAELKFILDIFPEFDRKRILFTPNFAPIEEYQQALDLGINVTLDNLFLLQKWPQVFTGKEIFIRVDPGQGYGHHKFVVTGGNASKFGIGLQDLSQVAELAKNNRTRIVGLHTHRGSGILDASTWKKTATVLMQLLQQFPEVQTVDLGGGFGIVERAGQRPLDLAALDNSLASVKSLYPNIQLWVEPGRFLVAQSGVLLASVTQIKYKSGVCFVGIETGMNSLIRPALYGSFHQIVNLSRLNQPLQMMANIVGPICESGDILGYSRLLPTTKVGDVLLIANTGAYGHCMSSHYNLRRPAQEYFLVE